jgi:hypothetical protein
LQVIHRAIEPKNVVWKERGDQPKPVIQLISLGHAKLEKTIEDEELAFIEGAKSGAALRHASAVAGAISTFQPLSDRQANPFLASEYKHDVVHQPHYAMDWFAGLNHQIFFPILFRPHSSFDERKIYLCPLKRVMRRCFSLICFCCAAAAGMLMSSLEEPALENIIAELTM